MCIRDSLYILANIISAPFFNYKAYRDQMDTPIMKEFSSDVQVLDRNQIPVVDKDLARILADRKLGEKPSLGSQVVLGEPTIQNVNGELIWAVPLHHSGFFKWLVNMDGADGYIVVSATNPQDVRYVDDHKIKIQPDSYPDSYTHLDVYKRQAETLGVVDAYKQSADEAGGVCNGDGGYIAKIHPRLFQSALHHPADVFAVAAGGDFRHHAAVFFVFLHLGGDDTGKDGAPVLDDGGCRFVTGAFDGQDVDSFVHEAGSSNIFSMMTPASGGF